MKSAISLLTIRCCMIFGAILLLSSCAPAPGIRPSGALKEQLNTIKQQQQNQAMQLQQLQQQLSQLQQQLSGGKVLPPTTQQYGETANTAGPIVTPPPSNQLTGNQNAVHIAASASSYLEAFSNLAAGNAAAAEVGFQNFLSDFPDHQYAPNARYWLANAQLSQGKTDLAITNLNQIVSDPKAQAKAPAALMQLAQIYRQEGLSIQADNVLEQLRNLYPDSLEAQQFYRSDEPTD